MRSSSVPATTQDKRVFTGDLPEYNPKFDCSPLESYTMAMGDLMETEPFNKKFPGGGVDMLRGFSHPCDKPQNNREALKGDRALMQFAGAYHSVLALRNNLEMLTGEVSKEAGVGSLMLILNGVRELADLISEMSTKLDAWVEKIEGIEGLP